MEGSLCEDWWQVPAPNAIERRGTLRPQRLELRQGEALSYRQGVASLRLLGTFTLGGSPITVDLYFTDTITQVQEQRLDDDERIQVLFCPVAEVQERVRTGEWPDLRLAIALAMAREQNLL